MNEVVVVCLFLKFFSSRSLCLSRAAALRRVRNKCDSHAKAARHLRGALHRLVGSVYTESERGEWVGGARMLCFAAFGY